MKLRIAFTTIQILPVIYLLVRLLAGGTLGLQDDFVLPAYAALIVFTLPSLLSKLVWQRAYFGTTSALNFLYFPLVYIFSVIAGKLVGTTNVWVTVLALATVIMWNVLLAFAVWTFTEAELKKFSLVVGVVAGIGVVYALYLIVTLRSTDSVLALDYLQHNTVVSAMQAGKLCLLPGTCSNLFLQQGYTTFYHSVLSTLTALGGGNLPRLIFMLDLAFAGVMGGLVFKLMWEATHRYYWAVLGTVLALLVFVNGAYEFSFFIPQTFALMLFLHLVSSKHSLRSLMIGITLLVLSHFIIGSFLAVILILKVTFIDDYIADERAKMYNWPLVIVLIMAPIFSMVLNLAGFSVERNLQGNEVQTIGSLTNLYSPDNLIFVASILGFASLVLILAIVYWVIHKNKTNWIWLALIVLSINVTVYFLGPTYANKFMITSGIFASLLIVTYLQAANLKAYFVYAISAVLALIFGVNFFTQYQQYEHFYLQDSGVASAIVPEDKPILDFLKTSSDNCLIISDPYTQIIVAGITGKSTANAQYMIPESRKRIETFNEQPNDANYEKLLEMKEIAGEKSLCYLYTSRMEESVKSGYRYWVDSIYSYILDNNYPMKKTPAAITYLSNRKSEVLFRNANFYLVKLAEPAANALDKQ